MGTINQFQGCIFAGAIGDAWGSGYENLQEVPKDVFMLFETPEPKEPNWQITDDTQLTLATIEGLVASPNADPAIVAQYYLNYYQQRKLSGLGASTLKALQELKAGGHWSQVGRRGEHAAGNGAAMRIAPLAFCKHISRSQVRDICRITHHNDEAYVGALCVVLAIRAILEENWDGTNSLIELLVDQIPDTLVRDRLIAIKDIDDLEQIGQMGNNGYVVNSVPLAIAAANQVLAIGMEQMFQTLIDIGGDTDTNCSIAGQIAGTLVGKNHLPKHLLEQLFSLSEWPWIERVTNSFLLEMGTRT